MLDAVLVWFRRDLRADDHAALSEALRRARRVYCAFVFDREILDRLPTKRDRRVEFVHTSLVELDSCLRLRGGDLIVRHDRATDEIPRLARKLGVNAVFTNRDYEPIAKQRDAVVTKALQADGIGFESFKDQVVFDGAEVLTLAGKPYTVFTPYKNAWLKRLTDDDCCPYTTAPSQNLGCLIPGAQESTLPTLEEIGFAKTDLLFLGIEPGSSGARRLLTRFCANDGIGRYAEQRDFPSLDACSRLSIHLRFGTISIRELVALAIAHGARNPDHARGPATWLSELVWREFYFMILDRFPHVAETAFKPEYDDIEWEYGEAAESLFSAWCAGQTGYPLIDAAMRQLNATGYMHNRLRMLVASFLSKDLGIDWRRGEAYFASQLNDFDLAANNGGWQWAASTGCDAQPYFRIFNPVTQSTRFDQDGEFIRRYLPELAPISGKFIHAPWQMDSARRASCGVRIGREYPAPIVEHDKARLRTLSRYAAVKRSAGG